MYGHIFDWPCHINIPISIDNSYTDNLEIHLASKQVAIAFSMTIRTILTEYLVERILSVTYAGISHTAALLYAIKNANYVPTL